MLIFFSVNLKPIVCKTLLLMMIFRTVSDVITVDKNLPETSYNTTFNEILKYTLSNDFILLQEMLGTAQSIGCTVDNQPPHDIIEQIQEGSIVCPDE